MSEFSERVRQNLEGIGHLSPGVVAGCPQCPDVEDYGGDLDRTHQDAQEASWSWKACGSCGTRRDGDRHPAHAWAEDADPVEEGVDGLYHLLICTDCLLFHVNGEEPDPAEMEAWTPVP